MVLERFTPILVSKGVREEAGGNAPVFVWVDRGGDVLHFVGGEQTDGVFERAGGCAWSELYR